MRTFYKTVINRPKTIIAVFAIAFIICLVCQQMVSVNYDMTDYLPKDSHSTVSLEIMEYEFEGGIPNARVMIYNVTIPQALEYKEKLAEISGVTDVTWLDDTADLTQPIETMDADTVETYYKDDAALFTVTIEKVSRIEAVAAIRDLIGDENAMTGSAVSTAVATESTVKEVGKIAVIGVLFVLFVLTLTTSSWIEPIIVLAGIGIAVIINAGSNLIFGEISFVTNAAGNILQLAVSLDYSVFLIHRFTECRRETPDVKEAMVDALCKSTTSILSSGLTTVIGFAALIFMRFGIGPDLGLALAKGIAISLLTVFVFMPVFILVTYKLLDKTEHQPLVPSADKFGKFVCKAMIPFVCIFILVIAPSYLASNANDYYFGATHMFNEQTQLGADTASIKEVFGKSDTYVLLVPKGNNAAEKQLSGELKTLPQVTNIISYVDTVGSEIPMSYLDEGTLSKLISQHYSRMVISVDADYEGDETFSLVEAIRDTANIYYPDSYYLAGEGVSTYDLMDTITDDMATVNLIAIGAVFVVLLLAMKSISIPVILVLGIETAIWINLSIPYFTGSTIFYIAYLIISSIQLGATVDYAILLTDRYRECRETMDKKESIINTMSAVTVSILTSGSVLTVVGFLLGYMSTNGLLSQLGFFLGKGTLCSLAVVLFVLPGLLYILDGLIQRTTFGIRFINNKK